MTKPDGYDEYIKSAQWRNIAKLMKKQAGYRCAHCKFASTTLEVHHLTYERFGGKERMSDLVVLCEPCHEIADEKRVVERELRGENARVDAAYSTYMGKVYGDDWLLLDLGDTRTGFYEWLAQQNQADLEQPYESLDADYDV
jgi:hypothetical protein